MPYSLRVSSSLPPELEDLVRTSIGCCLAVHRGLGAGLLEHVYLRALAIELESERIPFELERAVPVRYRDRLLCHHRIDMVIDDQLIIEAKSVECLGSLHVAQIINYVRLTKLRVGLLVNFNVPILKHGIRRIVV